MGIYKGRFINSGQNLCHIPIPANFLNTGQRCTSGKMEIWITQVSKKVNFHDNHLILARIIKLDGFSIKFLSNKICHM